MDSSATTIQTDIVSAVDVDNTKIVLAVDTYSNNAGSTYYWFNVANPE